VLLQQTNFNIYIMTRLLRVFVSVTSKPHAGLTTVLK